MRQRATFSDGVGEVEQQLFSCFPADTCIGNRLAVGQFFTRIVVLAAFDQMAFNHHAENRFIARSNLGTGVVAHHHLATEIFAAVAVAKVDHDFLWQADSRQISARCANMRFIVIRRLTTTQNHVAIWIAASGHNR